MAESKLVTLSADGATATVAAAGGADFLTTVLSADKAVTGVQKYLQLGVTAAAAMMFANRRHTGSLTNFG